eukprot:gene11553-20600_t
MQIHTPTPIAPKPTTATAAAAPSASPTPTPTTQPPMLTAATSPLLSTPFYLKNATAIEALAAQAMASEEGRRTLTQAEQRKALRQARTTAKAALAAAAADEEKTSARIAFVAARLANERFDMANPPLSKEQREATKQQRQAEKTAKQQQRQAEKAAKQQQKQAEKAAKQQQKQAEKKQKKLCKGKGKGKSKKVDLAAADQETVFRCAEAVGLRLAAIDTPTTPTELRAELQQARKVARQALDTAATKADEAAARGTLIDARLMLQELNRRTANNNADALLKTLKTGTGAAPPSAAAEDPAAVERGNVLVRSLGQLQAAVVDAADKAPAIRKAAVQTLKAEVVRIKAELDAARTQAKQAWEAIKQDADAAKEVKIAAKATFVSARTTLQIFNKSKPMQIAKRQPSPPPPPPPASAADDDGAGAAELSEQQPQQPSKEEVAAVERGNVLVRSLGQLQAAVVDAADKAPAIRKAAVQTLKAEVVRIKAELDAARTQAKQAWEAIKQDADAAKEVKIAAKATFSTSAELAAGLEPFRAAVRDAAAGQLHGTKKAAAQKLKAEIVRIRAELDLTRKTAKQAFGNAKSEKLNTAAIKAAKTAFVQARSVLQGFNRAKPGKVEAAADAATATASLVVDDSVEVAAEEIGATTAAQASGSWFGSIGLPWTRDEIEPPQGTKDMGSWTAAVYTAEQQSRLTVDERGAALNNA